MANVAMPPDDGDMSVAQVDNNFSSKSGDGDGKFIRPPAFYDAWQKGEGIPIYKAYHLDDMNDVELAPWKRFGCDGAFVNLADPFITTSIIIEIAPGQKYYPTTLHVLSIMAALSRGGPCLDAPGVRAVASPTWRPRPAQITPDWRTDDDEAAAHEFLMAPGGPERSAPRTSAEAAPSAAVTPLVRLLFWTGLLAAPFLAAAL